MATKQSFSPLTEFAGLWNQTRTPNAPWGALSAADDVVFLKGGGLMSRFGYESSGSQTSVTSVLPVEDETYHLVLDDGVLYRDDGKTQTVVASGLTDTWLASTSVADYVFYAGATDSGQVRGARGRVDLRVPEPPPPEVTEEPPGVLPGGHYGILQVWTHEESGIETAASPKATIELATDNSAMRVAVAPPEGWVSDIYVAVDGGIAYRWAGRSSGGSLLIVSSTFFGMMLDAWRIGLVPLPSHSPVIALAWYDRRLHAAYYDEAQDVTFVFYSKMDHPHLFNAATDNYAVPGKVRAMQGVDEGVLIASSSIVALWTVEDYTAASGGALRTLHREGCPSGQGRLIDRDAEGHVVVATLAGLGAYDPGSDKLLFPSEASFKPPMSDAASAFLINREGQAFALLSQRGEQDPMNYFTR